MKLLPIPIFSPEIKQEEEKIVPLLDYEENENIDNDLELDTLFDMSSQSDCDEEIFSQEFSQVSLED